MTADNSHGSEPDGALQQVIADYLTAETAGRPSDRTVILARHPELAKELQTFFTDHDQARAWAKPMCMAGANTPSPARDAITLDTTQASTHVLAEGGTPGKSVFGDYEIIEEIARGGMGVVFKARHVALNRVVALKMILAGQLAGEANIQRFQTEARAAAHLDHPNLVPIYEVGVCAGQHFFSMKLVEGGSLAEWLAAGRLPTADLRRHEQAAAQLVARVARAVHYAHQRGILHRDLKPANILLQSVKPRGEATINPAREALDSAIPMVTDFGLAKRLSDSSGVTHSGVIVGTPSYMAPEQAVGQTALSTAVDVYSLGAILFELLTGRPPFRADSTLELLRQVIDHEPPRPRSLAPQIDRDLEIICLKCLHKDPQRRYGSAEALAEDLERWLAGEPIRARAASRWEQVTKWAKRRPAAAALIVVSVLAPLVVLLVGLSYNADLNAALKDVRQLKGDVVNEKANAVRATAQARKDADEASNANRQAQAARTRADHLVREARGLRLVADARVVLPDNPALGLLLALEAAQRGPRLASHNNLLAAAWSACRERGPVLRSEDRASMISAAFFPDGKRILLTTLWSIRIWDRAMGKEVARWNHPGTPIVSSSISPDGRYVAVTCRNYQLATYSDKRRILHTDRVAHLWDTTTDTHTILKGHENRVVSACFSPDSKRILTASWDQTARIWDARTGETIHVLKGHTSPLEAASFSADGKTVFTASTGAANFSTVPARAFERADAVDVPVGPGVKQVGGGGGNTGDGGGYRGGDLARIWDTDTGKELKVIPAPFKNWAVYGPPRASLSPDGKYVAGILRGKAFLWDVQAAVGRSLGTDRLASRPMQPVFSPDSKLLLASSGSENQAVRIWETATGKEVGILVGHEDRILSAHFTDARRVITRSLDKTCRLWYCPGPGDVNRLTESEFLVLKGHELEPVSAHGSPNGNTLVTAAADDSVRFWNIQKQEPLGRMIPTGDHIWCSAISPDATRLATGSADGTVRYWDIASHRLLAQWRGHSALKATLRKQLLGGVIAMSFSADGKKLLTVSADPVGYLQDRKGQKTPLPENSPARIWDVATGKELPFAGGHEGAVAAAHFSPDGTRIVTVAGSRLRVRFFNDKRVPIGGGEMNNHKDRSARVWDSVTGKQLFALTGKWREIGMASWNHDGTRLVTTHEDALRIWNAADGTEVMQLGQKQRITSALFSPDGRRLLTWYDTALVHRGAGHWQSLIRFIENQADLWDAATGRHIATLKGHAAPINFAAFSPDGTQVVTTAEAPNSFSSTGRTEDTIFRDRTARLWDAATGRPLRVLRGHVRSVRAASFSKDSKRLVTTSSDRTVRIWDLATGKEFFTLSGHRETPRAAAFTPDGRFVVITSWDGTVGIWPADPLPLALQRKPRELTAEERDRFGLDHKQ